MTLDWKTPPDGAVAGANEYGIQDGLKKAYLMFNGSDISPTHVQIHGNVRWEFSDGVIRLLNTAKTFYTKIKAGNVAANYDASIPLLAANDTFAMLGIANTFSQNIIIQKASSPTITIQGDGSDTFPIEKLYSNRTTAVVAKTLGKQQISEKISAAEKVYYELEVISDDVTAATEDASVVFKAIEAGTLTEFFRLKGGIGVALAALRRLYLDGGGDTYIVESAANTVDHFAGGIKALTITSSAVTSKITHQIEGGLQFGTLRKIFTEEFAGKALDTTNIWTQNTLAGTPTFGYNDAIDGGFRITTSATIGHSGSITTGGFRYFDPTRCTIYGIISFDNVNTKAIMGICSATDMDSASNHLVGIRIRTDTANIELVSANGTTISADASDIARSAANVPYKIVCTSSDLKLYLLVAGVWTLKVTKTTNRPTTRCQPCFQVKALAAAAVFGTGIYIYIQSD